MQFHNLRGGGVIQFKDENLKKAILSYLKKPRYNDDGKLQNLIDQSARDITEDDALKVTALDLSSSYIESLEGIEKFKNLIALNLVGNYISDITPLKNLSKLRTFYSAFNNISDITPLTNLTNLEELSIPKLQISDIKPLANLTNLTKLYLSENQISDLTPLANLTNLTELWLSENQISDITPLKNLTNLTSLDLHNNHISDITSLAGLTKLKTLNAKGQTITLRPESSTVELAKEIKGYGHVVFGPDENIVDGVLTYKDGMEKPYSVTATDGSNYSATVKIFFSPIIQFKDKNLKNAILAEMKQQNLISQSAGNITEYDTLKVTELKLDEKSITSVEGLEKFKNLTKLDLHNNHISDITPLKSLPNLTTLNAKDQTITLQPKSIKVDLAKEIKGAGKVTFNPGENIVDGVLTYKDGMEHPYTISADRKSVV